MKTLLLIVFEVCFWTMSAYAQPFQTIPNRGHEMYGTGVIEDGVFYGCNKIWYYQCVNADNQYCVVYAGDCKEELKDGKPCIDIAFTSNDSSDSDNPWCIMTHVLYCQDGGKVYYYDSDSKTFVLMFDFDMQVGDYACCNGVDVQVEKVGTSEEIADFYKTTTPSGTTRVLWVSNRETPEQKDIWIEGVGSIKTGIMPRNLYESISPYLLYALDVERIHTVSVDTDVFKEKPGDDFFKTEEEIVNECVLIAGDEQMNELLCEFRDDTLHVEGLLYNYNARGIYFTCRVENNCIYLQSEEYGFAYYHGRLRRCRCEFTGFSPGTYTIYLNNQEGQMLMCETPTGLKSVSGLIGASSVYDLTGRRLTQEPVHGLYIRDGRKYLKR